MTTQFNVGDNVIDTSSGLKATIINIINTIEDFTKMGQEHPLLVKLGFNDIPGDFEEYANDDTQFPMNIFIFKEKSVFNRERMDSWINKHNLRDELNRWLITPTGELTTENKKQLIPIAQLRRFMVERATKIIIPTSFYDHAPINPDNETKLGFAPDNELKLAFSGGRSRKRRRQYRIKKSRSRSRK
jgi:hypothetical protein